jgi:hypothetical protein
LPPVEGVSDPFERKPGGQLPLKQESPSRESGKPLA